MHILCSVNFFPENCAVYEIMSKNMFEPEWPQVTISNLIEVFRDFSSVVRWMPGYNLKKGHGPHSPSPMFLPVFACLRLRLRHSGFESQKDLGPKYAPPPHKSESHTMPDRGPKLQRKPVSISKTPAVVYWVYYWAQWCCHMQEWLLTRGDVD
jgi:hypothetical protein